MEQERNTIDRREGADNERRRQRRLSKMQNTTIERRKAARRDSSGLSGVRPGRRVPLFLQLLGAALVVSSVVVGVSSSHAAAADLSNGPVTIQTASGATAKNPLQDSQVVTVSVSANSTLSQSSLEAAGFPSGVVGMKVIQCADPGGQVANLPQNLTSCAPATLVNGPNPQQDGSVSVEGFTVYTVPDVAVLGASNGTMCDTQHECVLGIFSNQEDFSKPHLFSAPFLVAGGTETAATSPSGTSSSGTNSTGSSGSQTAPAGASAGVSVSPATLANTGAPSLWPWLLGAGCILLLAGSGLRYFRRLRYEGRT
jgi:hypothetical protein